VARTWSADFSAARPCRTRSCFSKLDSRAESFTLRLEPARKLLGGVAPAVPQAILVGWKYELAGTRQDALAKAWRQLQENRTDACVLNGRAYAPASPSAPRRTKFASCVTKRNSLNSSRAG